MSNKQQATSNKQQATTLGKQPNLVNGKWKVFCAVLALVYGNCAFGMDNNKDELYENSRSESKKQYTDNPNRPNKSVKTPASKIQQSLNEIKQITENNQEKLNEIGQTIENNQQKLIEIITDLRKQSDEQSEETKETKPKLTFGGVDPNASGKKSFDVSSDGRVHYDVNNEQQKNRLNITFGGQGPYKSVPQNSNQNSQMPNFNSGGSNSPKNLEEILKSLSNQNSHKSNGGFNFSSGTMNIPRSTNNSKSQINFSGSSRN
ncbi:MAG: hypothetical protein K5766_00925 [Alphaproteobacteria bacterium]|nr:hypothetical protein [Alphaproteobacteria bacterium]